MDILQVVRPLVCTSRIPGLAKASLRVLRDGAGTYAVAVDPVGAHNGNWVFVVSGSAGRYAAGDYGVLTDLTIGGIIDHWETEEEDRAGGEVKAAGNSRTNLTV